MQERGCFKDKIQVPETAGRGVAAEIRPSRSRRHLANLTIIVVSKSGKHDEGHATLSCDLSMGPDDWAGLLTKKSVSTNGHRPYA
jgi:hypothetical protein